MSHAALDPVHSHSCLRIAHSFLKSANDSVQAPFAGSFCSKAIYRWQTPSSHLKVTICITQGPAPLNVAVALLLPAVVTTLSSAISPSGVVMMRDVNPLPAPPVSVATMFAPKINSFAFVVVAVPLFDVALLPTAPAVTSSVVTPRYSRIRISGNEAAWLNVTVTVLLPPAMFAA